MPIAARLLLTSLMSIALVLLSGCDGNNRQSAPPTRETVAAAAQYPATSDRQPATYTGSHQCAGCHRAEFENWRGSHHDLAMQEANGETVLGDFNNSRFEHFGIESRFHTRDGRYFVHTDGPDGQMHDYPIAYTFGVQPLQQYLVEFPGGRLQALSIAWDSRPASEGGQRWFHLNPEEPVRAGDALHWTGLNYNWNFMCADCHSTNLQKNYDLADNTFDTRWSEIDVGCEACHGPGSRHAEWARQGGRGNDRGLTVDFSKRKRASWIMDTDTGIAHREPAGDRAVEINTCARCHSRRATRFPESGAHGDFLDSFHPALLSEELYHADGQIDGEVYVYGSFLQSRMHAAGVTCSDCHQPHSMQLRAEGNALCAQCHLPARFDTAGHHFHPPGSTGAECVNCHMPAKKYMQVDGRRDHSFRIPRPDLSAKLGTPDACTGCHTDRGNAWAASVLKDHFGAPPAGHYGEAIHAGRTAAPGAPALLARLVADRSQPEIARATAVSLLTRYPSAESLQILQAVSRGDAPLMNLGLAGALESVPQQVRPALAIPLLYDQSRVTTSLAAGAMAGLPVEDYPQQVRQRYAQALDDYLQSEQFNADRPESLLNIARQHLQRGNPRQAGVFYRRALQLAPYFTPAYINLAELYRNSGREREAESLLRDALGRAGDKSTIEHALGLSLVRQQRKTEALEHLRRAAEGAGDSSRYIYVYAIALNSAGKTEAALEVLSGALQRFPGNTRILQALISIHREAGNTGESRRYRQLLQGRQQVRAGPPGG